MSLDGAFEDGIIAAAEHQAGKQIVEQPQEERLVLVNQLAEIHVPQDAHHDDELGVIGVASLLITRRPKHGQDVAQPEIVMDLQKTAMGDENKLAKHHHHHHHHSR